MDSGIRLQKYLADCGVGSRRACEALILAGEVAVDGVPATVLGTRVLPREQQVTLRGRRIRPEPRQLLMLNKPAGYLCTNHDPQGRPTYQDLLSGVGGRVYPVGRLDLNSEGLLLVTNDGTLAHRLTHPSHEVEKEYRVFLERRLTPAECRTLCSGVYDEGELLRALSIDPWRGAESPAEYRWVLGEGRNRQIRRMAAAVECRVVRLRRVALGSLRLGNLPSGQSRPLTDAEERALARAAGITG